MKRRYIDKRRSVEWHDRTGSNKTMYLRIVATREGGAYGRQTETQKAATHAGGTTEI